MDEREIIEIRRFTVIVCTFDMIGECAGSQEEADQLIVLAASYGPCRNTTQETD